MFTALISTIVGIVGSMAGDIFKEVVDSREHRRELERQEASHKFRLLELEAETKAMGMRAEMAAMAEEMGAFREQMANIYKSDQRRSGVRWIDGFNAFIRPYAAFVVVNLFILVAGLYTTAILQQFGNGIIDLKEAATLIWSSMIGEAIQAVLGFLFGYRLTRQGRKEA